MSKLENQLRWIRIHDRVQAGEMPPEPSDLPADQREILVRSLAAALHDADMKDVEQLGRGPMRRLNRNEYQQNLRDSNTHDNTNLPILLAGGGFRHGQHLSFRHDHNTPLCNLFVSMLQQLGIDASEFGSSTGALNGLKTA